MEPEIHAFHAVRIAVSRNVISPQPIRSRKEILSGESHVSRFDQRISGQEAYPFFPVEVLAFHELRNVRSIRHRRRIEHSSYEHSSDRIVRTIERVPNRGREYGRASDGRIRSRAVDERTYVRIRVYRR